MFNEKLFAQGMLVEYCCWPQGHTELNGCQHMIMKNIEQIMKGEKLFQNWADVLQER